MCFLHCNRNISSLLKFITMNKAFFSLIALFWLIAFISCQKETDNNLDNLNIENSIESVFVLVEENTYLNTLTPILNPEYKGNCDGNPKIFYTVQYGDQISQRELAKTNEILKYPTSLPDSNPNTQFLGFEPGIDYTINIEFVLEQNTDCKVSGAFCYTIPRDVENHKNRIDPTCGDGKLHTPNMLGEAMAGAWGP